MKKLSKILALVLCGLMAFSVVGCAPEEVDPAGNRTKINIQIYDAGVGIDWLKTLTANFASEHEETEFEPGKKGVYFDIESVTTTDTAGMKNSDVHFYVTHGTGYTGRTLANDKLVANITDVTTSTTGWTNPITGNTIPADVRVIDGNPTAVSIKDKYQSDYYNDLLCIANGDCYAVSNYGIKTGLSFDAFNWKFYGLYLADPTWAVAEGLDSGLAKEVTTKFGTRYLVTGTYEIDDPENFPYTEIPAGAKLACGNDGVFGTWDDGHPTSLEEFYIICSYMKTKWGIAPLTSYGSSHAKRVEMFMNLWTSMGGFGDAQARYNQNSEGHKVEIIDYSQGDKGFKTDKLFGDATPNHYDIYTTEVAITKENGYQAYDSAARYFAIANLQICFDEGWYSDMSSDSKKDHIASERMFVLNGLQEGTEAYQKCGMLIEGDYWYNEVKIRSKALQDFKMFIEDTPREGMEEPDILWLSLPTQLKGSVQPNVDKDTGLPYDASQGNVPASAYNEHVEQQGAGAPIVINDRFKNNPNIMALLKEFMFYINTDDALTIYTATTGCYRVGLDYEVDLESDYSKQLSQFQRATMEAFATCQKRLVPVSTKYAQKNVNQLTGDGGSYYSKYESKSATTGENARKLFETRTITASDWAKLIKE